MLGVVGEAFGWSRGLNTKVSTKVTLIWRTVELIMLSVAQLFVLYTNQVDDLNKTSFAQSYETCLKCLRESHPKMRLKVVSASICFDIQKLSYFYQQKKLTTAFVSMSTELTQNK